MCWSGRSFSGAEPQIKDGVWDQSEDCRASWRGSFWAAWVMRSPSVPEAALKPKPVGCLSVSWCCRWLHVSLCVCSTCNDTPPLVFVCADMCVFLCVCVWTSSVCVCASDPLLAFYFVCVPSHTRVPLCLCEHHQSQPPRRSTQLHTQAFKKTPSNPVPTPPKVNTAYSLWHLAEGEDYIGAYQAGIGSTL